MGQQLQAAAEETQRLRFAQASAQQQLQEHHHQQQQQGQQQPFSKQLQVSCSPRHGGWCVIFKACQRHLLMQGHGCRAKSCGVYCVNAYFRCTDV